MNEKIFSITPLFNFLSEHVAITEEEKDELIKMVEYDFYDKGETIVSQGSMLSRLGLIIQGAVRFYSIDESGNEDNIDFCFENEIISNFKGLEKTEPAPGTAQALEPTYILYTNYNSFLNFLLKFPHYYSAVMAAFSTSTNRSLERSRFLKIQSSRERYEAFVLDRPEVVKRISLTYIASYLGMALGTLSRVRAGKL